MANSDLVSIDPVRLGGRSFIIYPRLMAKTEGGSGWRWTVFQYVFIRSLKCFVVNSNEPSESCASSLREGLCLAVQALEGLKSDGDMLASLGPFEGIWTRAVKHALVVFVELSSLQHFTQHNTLGDPLKSVMQSSWQCHPVIQTTCPPQPPSHESLCCYLSSCPRVASLTVIHHGPLVLFYYLSTSAGSLIILHLSSCSK